MGACRKLEGEENSWQFPNSFQLPISQDLPQRRQIFMPILYKVTCPAQCHTASECQPCKGPCACLLDSGFGTARGNEQKNRFYP